MEIFFHTLFLKIIKLFQVLLGEVELCGDKHDICKGPFLGSWHTVWRLQMWIGSLVVHVPEAWSTGDAEMVGRWAITRSWGPPREWKDGLLTSASLSQISWFPASHLSIQGSPLPFWLLPYLTTPSLPHTLALQEPVHYVMKWLEDHLLRLAGSRWQPWNFSLWILEWWSYRSWWACGQKSAYKIWFPNHLHWPDTMVIT